MLNEQIPDGISNLFEAIVMIPRDHVSGPAKWSSNNEQVRWSLPCSAGGWQCVEGEVTCANPLDTVDRPAAGRPTVTTSSLR